jgi:hypothetical protein
MKGLLTGLFLLLSWGMAQTNFSGVYVTLGRAGDVVLTLEQTDDGQITGTIAGNGVSYNLSGFVNEAEASGYLESDEYAIFAVTFGTSPNELIFTLTDSKGEQPFTFTGRGDAPAVKEEVPATSDAAQDTWIGLFNNEEATRGFQVDAVNNGEYTGNLIIDGFEYPFTATGDEANLAGNYVVGGDALVPFRVIKDGDTVTLEFPDNPESNAVLTKAF